jgi:hypothetical protein
MDDSSSPDTREVTLWVACLSLASTGLLLLIWIPVCVTAKGAFRAPITVPMIEFILVLLAIGTVPPFPDRCGPDGALAAPGVRGVVTRAQRSAP